jgi:hypothetical protein
MSDPASNGWQKFSFKALRDPAFKKLRSSAQMKVLRFVLFSFEWGQPGAVSRPDDEIASELELSLDKWLSLRDLMVLRGIIRESRRVLRPAALTDPEYAQRVYEIAFWLLPDQDTPGQAGRDGRIKEAWGQIVAPSYPEECEENQEMQRRAGRPAKSAEGARTGRERKALFDRRKYCKEHGLPQPDEEAWLADYRAKREADPSAEDSDRGGVTKLPAENGGEFRYAEKGNETHFVTPRAGASEIRADENSSRQESPPAGSNEIPASNEIAAVVTLLSETGIPNPEGECVQLTRSVAEQLARTLPHERIHRQCGWLKFRTEPLPEGKTWAARLVTCIREDWPIPDAARGRLREEKRRRKQEAAAAERRRAEEEDTVRLRAFKAGLDDAMRAELAATMRSRLLPRQREQYERILISGGEVQHILLGAENAVLREMMQAREPAAGAAERTG